eukprot:1176820-Prorocentrum_minimum.AAC.7
MPTGRRFDPDIHRAPFYFLSAAAAPARTSASHSKSRLLQSQPTDAINEDTRKPQTPDGHSSNEWLKCPEPTWTDVVPVLRPIS